MNTHKQPPIVSFVARPGVGKTTLVTQLIAELKRRGYRVGAIKHGHPNFQIDHPGKDSYRFSEAGADNVLIASGSKVALIKQYQEQPALEELVTSYFPDIDLILVEGFKKIKLPKIEINRSEKKTELICRGEEQDPYLLAVATDVELDVDVPQLDLNHPELIVDFLLHTFKLA